MTKNSRNKADVKFCIIKMFAKKMYQDAGNFLKQKYDKKCPHTLTTVFDPNTKKMYQNYRALLFRLFSYV